MQPNQSSTYKVYRVYVVTHLVENFMRSIRNFECAPEVINDDPKNNICVYDLAMDESDRIALELSGRGILYRSLEWQSDEDFYNDKVKLREFRKAVNEGKIA